MAALVPRVSLLVLCLAQPLAAQAPTLEAVQVERAPIFEPNQGVLGRLGNALHRTTRDRVIRRELLQRPGEAFDSLRAAETARNLRALGLFQRVFVDTVPGPAGPTLRVRTRDGWTLRPSLSLTATGGQTLISASLNEANFLGLGAQLAAQVQSTPDRDVYAAVYRHPRLIADRIGVQVQGEARSDGRALLLEGGMPYFAFTSRAQMEVVGYAFDGTVLRFRDGNPTPTSRLRRRYTLARLTAGRAIVASPRGAVRLGVIGQLRRDDFLAVADTGTTPFPVSTTGTLGLSFSAERSDYAIVRNVGSMLREEDVAVGPLLRVGVLAAPRAFGYANDGVGLESTLRLGARVGRGYAVVAAAATGRFAGGLDSGTVRLSGTVALRPSERQALVLRGQAGWKRNPVPGEEFDVGLGYGLRSFPFHAFTGDRLLLLGVEHRWTVSEQALGLLGWGVAAFGEVGGAWYAGSARRTGGNAGVGVRYAFTRGSETGVRRIDLVRRFATDRLAAGWSVVVGEGFAF